MAVAVEQRQLERLRRLGQQKFIFNFMVILEVRCFLQRALEKGVLIYVVCRSELLSYCLQPNFARR